LNGNQPVRDWILALSPEDRKRVGRDIQKVEFGWPIGMPYARSLGNGLWEVRSELTDGKIGRTIFCIARERMVLLHGFIKTQKTPAQDLKLALKRMEGGALKMAEKKGKIGSAFDDFLTAQGILEECEEQALKQILADQIKAAMEKDHLSKTAMAERMQTSRRALDRLLDPKNTSVTLHTLQRAAAAVGRQLRLELV
jgi:phage-related protein